MKCPTCGTVDTKVIFCEPYDDEITYYRRYRCGNGHRFTTMEVPDVMIVRLGKKKFRDARHAISGTITRNRAAYYRDLKIVRALAATPRPTNKALAAELGITPRRVSQLISEIRNKPKEESSHEDRNKSPA